MAPQDCAEAEIAAKNGAESDPSLMERPPSNRTIAAVYDATTEGALISAGSNGAVRQSSVGSAVSVGALEGLLTNEWDVPG